MDNIPELFAPFRGDNRGCAFQLKKGSGARTGISLCSRGMSRTVLIWVKNRPSDAGALRPFRYSDGRGRPSYIVARASLPATWRFANCTLSAIRTAGRLFCFLRGESFREKKNDAAGYAQ